MQKIQEIATLNIDNRYWSVPEETGKLIGWIINMIKARDVIEIGTGIGGSGLWMALELRKVRGKILTIESKEERFLLARKHFEEAKVQDMITQIKGHAPECLDEIKEEFDLAFFDATKKQTKSFFEGVWPKMRESGVILIDNVLSHQKEMSSFVDFIKKYDGVDWNVLEVGAGIGVVNRSVGK